MENTGGRIAVIGGGASGCMAAIAAARAGCSVTVFEKNEKIAKKIYATGNGRCNLTNLFLDSSCYHTRQGKEETRRVHKLIERFPQKDLIAFFRQAGLPVHDRDGYVYPRTDQAETVARTLEKCMRQAGVRICTDSRVEKIEKTKDGFRIHYCLSEKDKMPVRAAGKASEKRSEKKRSKKDGRSPVQRGAGQESVFDCQAVLLCTGGLAGPSFGCSGDGYVFADRLAHTVIDPLPALTRLECSNSFLRRAAGVRCHAAVKLLEEGKEALDQDRVLCEDGELQITETGISGIPVFQISGRAALLLAEDRRAGVLIDFLPEFTQEAFQKEIEMRLAQDRDQMLGDFLLGLVHRKVIDMILAREGLQAEMKARRLTDAELRQIMCKLRAFELDVTATGGFDHAQVTSGGIPLSEVDDDFASRKCPGLYMAGELLDVDGRCGGYNLQWAMTGGMLAGRAAASYIKNRL